MATASHPRAAWPRRCGRKTNGRRSAAIKCLLVAFLCFFFFGAGQVLAQSAFYTVSDEDLHGPPGTLIRQEQIFGGLENASAYRILYRSTGLDGHIIAVSGFVVIPDTPFSVPSGRPIVAWAHPTSGLVSRCAPSLARTKFEEVQGLADMIEHGFVVVATDYPGLGTEGPHPYLVGVSAGRAVLDSVRAVRSMPEAGGGNRFVAWGHSQGGQAVLFAGLLAMGYASDLELVGIAAAAPATNLATLVADDINTTAGRNLAAMTLWSWNRVFDAPIDELVLPAALPIVDQLAQECLESFLDLIERRDTTRPLQKAFLKVDDPTQVEPWRGLLLRNTPGAPPREIPVFLSQGTGDSIVRPAVTADYMRSLCVNGNPVQMMVREGVTHAYIALETARPAVQWMADRFAGRPAPSDCEKQP
ncbi:MULTISPECIES: alpha/beta fold hydrolase [unclassified Sinorhizobium]|uniref:alpha/beta fold hydrolase n=1 Tax=unclassified Sinorhizobium TaxID=2613772 RepID=UPI00352474FA